MRPVSNFLIMQLSNSREAILDNFAKEMPAYIEKLKKGETDVLGIENLSEENKN